MDDEGIKNVGVERIGEEKCRIGKIESKKEIRK